MNSSASKKSNKNAPKHCPNLGVYHIVNTKTGEIVQLPCNTYACPVCGERKAFKLQKALEAKFECFDYVRMFTFTFRTSVFFNQKHAIIRASEIWRRFINNVRRDKRLNAKLRNFQYVKLIEFTKRDYPHYHVLCDRYMPVKILSEHWNHAINTVCNNHGYNGSVNAKGMKSSKQAARYVTKYVLKTAREFKGKLDKYFSFKRNKLKLYTKSSLMKLFYPKSSLDHWEFIILPDFTTGQNLIYKGYCQLPQKLRTFLESLPPPDNKNEYSLITLENFVEYSQITSPN